MKDPDAFGPASADVVTREFERPERLYSRHEVVANARIVPDGPGLYGWYFDTLPRADAGPIGAVFEGRSLLYVGIARSLRSRLIQHTRRTARNSTLRMTLGCLLAPSLGLRLVPASGKHNFGEGEALINEWLDAHARVTWIEHPEPASVEGAVVRRLVLPLNREHNSAHPFYGEVGDARAAARLSAAASGRDLARMTGVTDIKPAVLARDIPVAHTPEGGWHEEMPPPVLAGCDEPIADGLPDFRGMWKAFAVEVDGVAVDDLRHVERIEQAGNRVVITARPIIHDMFADGTLENGVNDVSAAGFQPIQVAAVFEDGKLVLRPGNAFVAVTRHLEGEVLVWNLLPMKRVTWMRRVDG